MADEKLDIADNYEISLTPERIIAGQVQRLAQVQALRDPDRMHEL